MIKGSPEKVDEVAEGARCSREGEELLELMREEESGQIGEGGGLVKRRWGKRGERSWHRGYGMANCKRASKFLNSNQSVQNTTLPKEKNTSSTIEICCHQKPRPKNSLHTPQITCDRLSSSSRCVQVARMLYAAFLWIAFLEATLLWPVVWSKGTPANDGPQYSNRDQIHYGTLDQRYAVNDNFTRPVPFNGRMNSNNQNNHYNQLNNREYNFRSINNSRSYNFKSGMPVYRPQNPNNKRLPPYPYPHYPYNVGLQDKFMGRTHKEAVQGDGAEATVSAAAIQRPDSDSISSPAITTPTTVLDSPLGHVCTFEDDDEECQWTWDPPVELEPRKRKAGFVVTNGQSLKQKQEASNVRMHLPDRDSRGSETGEYLLCK